MFTDDPPITDYMILNVTSSSFLVSWSLNSTRNRTFQVQVSRGEELLRSARTQATTLEVTGLEAGVLYWVKTSYPACRTNVTAMLTVRTGEHPSEHRVCFLGAGHSIPILLAPDIQTAALLLTRRGQAWAWPCRPNGVAGAPCPLSNVGRSRPSRAPSLPSLHPAGSERPSVTLNPSRLSVYNFPKPGSERFAKPAGSAPRFPHGAPDKGHAPPTVSVPGENFPPNRQGEE